MTNVTNLRKDRPVAVRSGVEDGQKVYKINVGQTVDVPGFDPEREFNAALIDDGDIEVGESTRGRKKAAAGKSNEQLAKELKDAQSEYSNAKDALSEANKALKAENGDTPENKKAKSNAIERIKQAEKDLETAQKAFDKGADE